MYKPLDLSFPFGRWFASGIVKRDFDLIKKLGDFARNFNSRDPRSKLSIFIRQLSEIHPLLFKHSIERVKNANKADIILDECFQMIENLFNVLTKTEEYKDITHFWGYWTKIHRDKMLDHFYEFLLRMKVMVFEVKNDAKSEFLWEMNRFNYNLKKDLKPKVDIMHFIINYMMILMRDKWNIMKMFKQYHYCLTYCQKVLDGMTQYHEDLLRIEQYLHFAWVYYLGRLLDFSNQIKHATHKIEIDETCITFELEPEGPAPRFVLPDQPIASNDEIISLHANMKILEEDLMWWGNLVVCGDLTALDVLQRVKKYVTELNFD